VQKKVYILGILGQIKFLPNAVLGSILVLKQDSILEKHFLGQQGMLLNVNSLPESH
jgi:hypothetical protein